MLDIEKKNALRKDRIAYCMDSPNYLGGAGNHLLRHAVLSKEFGMDTLVCIPIKGKCEHNNIIEEICRDNDLEYVYVKYETSYNFNINIRNVLKAIDEFVSLVRKRNITMIHSVQINIGAELACRMVNIPHIMSIYQVDRHEFYPNYPDIFPHYIHSDSNLYADIWANGLHSYSRCIRSWIPQKFFKETKFEKLESKIKLMMSGTICNRKGQALVIEAIARLKKKGYSVELHLFGYVFEQDYYVQKCLELINKYGLKEDVHIYGFVKDIYSRMNDMTALICASTDESFPQVILEAMAMKIPIISTPVAGVPELLKDNINAFITNDFTSYDLFSKIEEFIVEYIENHEKIQKNVDKAFLTVNSVSSQEEVSRQLFEYYEYVLMQAKFKKLISKDYISIISNIIISLDCVKDVMQKVLNQQQLELYLKNEFRIKYVIEFLRKTFGNRRIRCLIWGTGGAAEVTKKIIEEMLPNFELIGYIDSFKIGTHNNKIIYSPNDIDTKEIEYIFIGTTIGKYDAYEHLLKKNFKAGYDCFDLII